MATITLTGNLTRDPEEITTKNGSMVVFSVAETERINRDGVWEDGETSFYDVRVFNGLGQNALKSLTKGQQVHITGDLTIRRTEKDGVKYTNASVRARELGASLRFATTVATKTSGGAKAAADIVDE